jgi:tetratricopeptide (TPR) repeat protein
MSGPVEGPTPSTRFQLLRRVAADGAGELWVGRDTTLDELVFLRLGHSGQPWAGSLRDALRKAFVQARRLHHRGVLRLLDFHPDDPTPAISMEPAPQEALSACQGRPASDWLPVLARVAETVAQAHRQGVVHRALTPERVFLETASRPRVWGFAFEALLERAAGVPATRYVSPQQAAGDPPAPADDVFAVGEMAAWLLGARPGEPVPETDGSGEPVPSALAALIDRLRADALADRHPDLSEAARELAAFGPAPAAEPGRPSGERLTPLRRSGQAGLSGPAADAPAKKIAGTSSGTSGRLLVWGGLAVLLAALAGVVFFLPSVVQDEQQAALGEAREEQGPADPAEDPQAEIRRLLEAKRSAEALLEDLEPIRSGLATRSVERWGGPAWRAAEEAFAAGQAAFERRDYATARGAWETALEGLRGVETGVSERLGGLLAAGEEALVRGDAETAVRDFEMALAMDPANAAADAGLARARNLPALMALMDAGASAEAAGNFDAAVDAYARAATLDPAHAPAAESRDRAVAARAGAGYRRLMSEGYAALAAGDYSAARERFSSAARMNPAADGPRDGLTQAEEGARRKRIEVLRAEADGAEAGERWAAAVTAYEAILKEDGNLAFAQEGLRRARARQALDGRLEGYLSDPLRLSADSVLAAARADLETARAVVPASPRLADQIERLDRQIDLADRPVPVAILSDNATEVTVYRVGRLGSFERQEIRLKPGRYTMVGTRTGYRDVRLEVTIMPGQAAAPVTVRCEEPI